MLAEVRMQGSSSRSQSMGGMARANLPSVVTLVAVTLIYQLVGWSFGWATTGIIDQTWSDGLKALAMLGLAVLATQPLIFGLMGMALLLEVASLQSMSEWMSKGGFTAWVLTTGQMALGFVASLYLISHPNFLGSGLLTWELITVGGWAYIKVRE